MRELQIFHHGRTVHGRVYLPEGGGKCPVIIFSHGYNGDGKDFAQSAEFFCRQGFGAVCFSFCGGNVREETELPTYEMTIFTEKEDLEAVIAEASSWEEVDTDRIFLFGGSMGGLVSALAAADLKERIRGLILLYPALCIPDDWRQKYPEFHQIPERMTLWDMILGKCYVETIYDLDIYRQIPKYEGEVLILHGTEDDIVPIEYSERAVHTYRNARLYRFSGEKHGFSEEGSRRVEAMAWMFAEDLCGEE